MVQLTMRGYRPSCCRIRISCGFTGKRRFGVSEAARKRAVKTGTGKAPTLGRRERNKQEKLGRILVAARDLFAAKGFVETTTQEIAERADIGTGTLFLYVKSKEDLLIMVFRDEMIQTSQAAFHKVSSDAPLIDQLMQVFGAMIAYHNRDLPLARALIREITILSHRERGKDVQVLMRIIYDGIGDIVLGVSKREKIRSDIDLVLVGETFFGIYYLGLIGWLNGYTSKQVFLKSLRAKLSLAIDGLRAGKPSTPKAPKAADTKKL